MELRQKIIFKPPFKKAQYKALSVSGGMRGLNGYYDYDTNIAHVNLSTLDFKGLTFDEKIVLFTQIMTHETLHHVIHEITGEVANDKEEYIVEMMVEESWR